MSDLGTSFSRHILAEVERSPGRAVSLAPLLTQIGYAAKILSREFGRAALVGKLGLVGEKNASGDSQKKLDVFANDTVIAAFLDAGLVSSIVSEELEEARCVSCESDAPYVLCIDPLDGSSNIDVYGDVGTVFGIYPRSELRGDLDSSFLRPGSEQVGAGYILYGASTMLVYTVGRGVHGFTLDRELGEFLLSHKDILCPTRGRTYSANLSRQAGWAPGIQKYVASLAAAREPRYSLRLNGALIADFHRCLLEGGIHFYPADDLYEDGKLRLLYECAPLAFVAEQAGGRASTGAKDILAVGAETLHQRVPFVVGSSEDVSEFEDFFQRG
jgi:fructose-1,6-bisphosphatase I